MALAIYANEQKVLDALKPEDISLMRQHRIAGMSFKTIRDEFGLKELDPKANVTRNICLGRLGGGEVLKPWAEGKARLEAL